MFAIEILGLKTLEPSIFWVPYIYIYLFMYIFIYIHTYIYIYNNTVIIVLAGGLKTMNLQMSLNQQTQISEIERPMFRSW